METSQHYGLQHKPFTVSGSTIEPQLNLIERSGRTVQVERQVMLVLLFLVERAGRVVTRDEILSALWSDSFSNDEALTQAVSKLRKALGDSAGESRTIQTIRKVGYLLIGPVSFPQRPQNGVRSVESAQGPTRGPRRTRNWSWAAIALVGTVTGMNALALYATKAKPVPRMVARTIIPGVDTSDVDLGTLADFRLGDMGGDGARLVLDSTAIAQVLDNLASQIVTAGLESVQIKRVAYVNGGED
jgi:DNA-binding winged helix-turn-helix (wHTH) protein